jgi:hypothetical protein
MKILDYALALDGGAQIITIEDDEGEQITFGLDGRMDSPLSGKQLFIGGSPDSPKSRLLDIGGPEELEVILLLEKWLDQTQSLQRREALIELDQAKLKGQDLLDRLGLKFYTEVKQRDNT